MDVLVELISNLGFPIGMVFYFIWDKTTATNKLTSAIENNNLILTRFLERFDKLDLEEKKHE